MKNHLLLALGLISISAFAQLPDEKKSVEATIQTLFTAMKKGDSSLLRTAFSDEVTMATVATGKDGNPVIKREVGIANFMKAIGTPHAEPYNEPIWNLKIEVDGRFAQAWCDYAFYLGNNFSHCGVDAFHLFKGSDGKWKVFHLADTRRKEGCNVPKKIANQFK